MLVMALTGTARAEPPPGLSAAEAKLWVTEEAFAATMAARDHDAFIGFLDPETVFFTGETVLRGRDAVAAAWEPYFEADEAPFAWAPEAAAVVTSGDLGMTSGPIFNRDGERIGTFSSVWRRTADGRWQIVLDRGCP
jgi:ketosteroid isomerase-like protein